MPGISTRKIMIAPWSVKIWLYGLVDVDASGLGLVEQQSRRASSNCVRMSMAKRPPRNMATSTETRYITPIRLWSSVKIQEEMPRLCVR